jgi:hypothetical protein
MWGMLKILPSNLCQVQQGHPLPGQNCLPEID